MARFENSVVINRPVEEVFAFMSDVEKAAQYESGVEERVLTSEGPLGVGSAGRDISRFLGRRRESTWEVTEFEPNKRVAIKSTSGPIEYQGSYAWESVGDATKVSVAFETQLGGFFRLAEPLVVRMARRQGEADLANLKDLRESQA